MIPWCDVRLSGITPAFAGKAPTSRPLTPRFRDHPRIRGEGNGVENRVITAKGSPPHSRGRPSESRRGFLDRGITPAFAGKAVVLSSPDTGREDHPRIRGEGNGKEENVSFREGSPPHSRGRPEWTSESDPADGITPAFAGKAERTRGCVCSLWDHPRIRGEGSTRPTTASSRSGSPPHSRGRHYSQRFPHSPIGITPAFAGKAPKIMDDPDARNLSRNHRRRDDKNLVVSQHYDSKILSFVQ